MRNWIAGLGLLLLPAVLGAAEAAAPALRPSDYWKDPDGFFERQAESGLDAAAATLARHPPGTGDDPARRAALGIVDLVLHEEAGPSRPAVREFFHAQVRRALARMKTTRRASGATLWKLYNHAFVVRTASVTFAFDLTGAGTARVPDFALPPAVIAEIAAECDTLFVSHRHADHADAAVARMFIAQGKPVVAPVSAWAGLDFHGAVTHLARDPALEHALPVRGGAAGLRVVAHPGHQGPVENNVVVVTTPEGLVFCHTGDQNQAADRAWMPRLGGDAGIDVLFPNCWSPDLPHLVQGAAARVVIPGHENELGHKVLHREPHWLTHDRLERALAHRAVVMTWGEEYHYERKPDAR
jgi:L-ascorbate metabolism protein UlaG (beta-lactamase superfamily)